MEDDQFQKNVKEAMNSDSLIFFFKSGDKHCNKSKKEQLRIFLFFQELIAWKNYVQGWCDPPGENRIMFLLGPRTKTVPHIQFLMK